MKIKTVALLLVMVIITPLLTGCELPFFSSDVVKYNDSLESATGKWQLWGDEDTYFIFDGSDNVMTFMYYEDGLMKYEGSFRAVYRSDPEANTPLTFALTVDEKGNEDWLNCLAVDFESDFTQFSIMYEEEDLGVTDGTVYTHIYRISEMPYKRGSYILEGNEHKKHENFGSDDGEYRIPEGSYVNDGGQCLTVVPIMNESFSLFRYNDGKTTVEGIFNIAQDRKTVYLYIEHDIYQKVRKQDKDKYDTTFSINYPPDFYLRGDFDKNDNTLVIDGLYHHPESPTEIDDSVWVLGSYEKQNG